MFRASQDSSCEFAPPPKPSDIERGGHGAYIILKCHPPSPISLLSVLRFMLLFHVLSRICGVCTTSKWGMVSICLSPAGVIHLRTTSIDCSQRFPLIGSISRLISYKRFYLLALIEPQIISWSSRCCPSCHVKDEGSSRLVMFEVAHLLELYISSTEELWTICLWASFIVLCCFFCVSRYCEATRAQRDKEWRGVFGSCLGSCLFCVWRQHRLFF